MCSTSNLELVNVIMIDPGLGEGYLYLKKSKSNLNKNFKDVKLQYHISQFQELIDIQDAKETGKRVMHSFEEKNVIMQAVITIVNMCMALLFIRIIVASQNYHDKYLINVEYDNIYITGYFRRIDLRRNVALKYTLLPMKKMERRKYIDIHSLTHVAFERKRLLCQVLKVLLEVVTATTFLMLDRLFYEALDVVRQHAAVEYTQQGQHDLEIEVEGVGMVAGIVRRVLGGLSSKTRLQRTVSNAPCLPRPRLMPVWFVVNIYGGYLWILVLLYFDAYTLRLRRLICSYFYPKREKQRILHLYNDILKKRMRMKKTLRKKAIQAVRAYYLSGETLLSLRLRFPQLLNWLRFCPAARKKCLICGEREPRSFVGMADPWQLCTTPRCPFLYCGECWREAGRRCLACDPSLPETSDADSITDEDDPW